MPSMSHTAVLVLLAAVAVLLCPVEALLGAGSGSRGWVKSAGRGRAAPLRMAAPTLEIYGNQGSRSPLINWYLTELGVPFVDADVRDPANKAKNPHLMGQIPALRDVDGGAPVALWESGAILLYISDKYGGLDTPAKRAAAGAWVVWANATLDPVLFKETPQGRVTDTGLRASPPARAVAALERTLSDGRQWLVDGTFGVADVAVGSYLLYTLMFFPDVSLAPVPRIAAYMARCARRPAYAAVFGPPTANALAERCEAFARP